MRIRYQNTPRDLVRIHLFGPARQIATSRTQYYVNASLLAVFSLLGAYGCFPHQPFIGTILIVGGGTLALSYFKAGRQIIQNLRLASPLEPRREIELEFSERGLLERISGVESFAPWSSIARYFVEDDAVSIELESGSWAIIPRETVDDKTALEALIATLNEKKK